MLSFGLIKGCGSVVGLVLPFFGLVLGSGFGRIEYSGTLSFGASALLAPVT